MVATAIPARAKRSSFSSTSGGMVVSLALLDVAPVDAERGQALLVVRGQHRRQVDGARPLGPVEAPDRLRVLGVHVHRLRAVAPGRGDGEGQADPLALEEGRGRGGLGDPADAGRGDDALDGEAVRVAQPRAQQLRHRARHLQRLALERLADALPPPVDRGADADLRHGPDQAVRGGSGLRRGFGSGGHRQSLSISAVRPGERDRAWPPAEPAFSHGEAGVTENELPAIDRVGEGAAQEEAGSGRFDAGRHQRSGSFRR